MSLKLSSLKKFLMIFGLLASLVLLGGCEGDDGQDGLDGLNGIDGVDGQDGEDGKDGEDYDPYTAVGPESCLICHGDAGKEGHQSVYDDT